MNLSTKDRNAWRYERSKNHKKKDRWVKRCRRVRSTFDEKKYRRVWRDNVRTQNPEELDHPVQLPVTAYYSGGYTPMYIQHPAYPEDDCVTPSWEDWSVLPVWLKQMASKRVYVNRGRSTSPRYKTKDSPNLSFLSGQDVTWSFLVKLGSMVNVHPNNLCMWTVGYLPEAKQWDIHYALLELTQ